MHSTTTGYHLPDDVRDWIKEQAAKENRSASNYLATVIRRMMNAAVNPS